MSKTKLKVEWWKAYLVWLGTMMVDLDHLLAYPIFDAGRCSIGYHPLHSGWAFMIYGVMLLWPNFWVRVIGLGLVWHMLVDGLDCLW